MHKIFDLREMDVDQLRSLAEELKVKGFKKMEKDDLVYAILDEEAKLNAQNAPEKPKRGRPRKEKAATEMKPAKQNDANEEKPVEKKEAAPVKKTEPKKKEDSNETAPVNAEPASPKEATENSGKKKGRKQKKTASACIIKHLRSFLFGPSDWI